jgi:hypothetical protein
MYSPSRQTFQLAQGVGTDQTLFNFSFSVGKQPSIDATATATATATGVTTPKGAHENVVPQLLNVSSEISVTEGTSHNGQIRSHSAIIEVNMNLEEESMQHMDVGDVSASSSLPRALVWSTESELATSCSDASGSGSGSAALTLRAKANKMQNEAVNAKHITAESEELSNTPGENNVKTGHSNAQPTAKKASRFIWREVGMLEAPGGAKSHRRHSSRYSYLNPELYGIGGYEGSMKAADAISRSSLICAVDNTESAEEVPAEYPAEADAEVVDATPPSPYEDSAPSQREMPIDLTVIEAEGMPEEEGDKVTAFSAPVLWHFDPDEVLQRFSNSNSNSNFYSAQPVELENLNNHNSSCEDPLVVNYSAVSESVSLCSMQDASVAASQEGKGADMTVKEAERMLSRVLKKNVSNIRGECIIILKFDYASSFKRTFECSSYLLLHRFVTSTEGFLHDAHYRAIQLGIYNS